MSHMLNKVGKELVLDLINRDNVQTLPQPLDFAHAVFSNPQVIPSPTSQLAKRGPNGEILYRNTRVMVTARPGAPFTGARVVDYHRIDVNILFKQPFRKLLGLGITSSLDLIQLLNNRFGLSLEATDIINEPINTTTLPTTYTMTMTPGCYAFVGQVEFELIDDLPTLEQLIAVNLLDGFHYAPAQEDDVGNPHHVTGTGHLMTMYGMQSVPGFTCSLADNEELQVFASAFNADIGNVAMALPEVNEYRIEVGSNGKVALAFGLGLLSELRGNDLTMLYDITMTISRPGTDPLEDVVFTLGKNGNGLLVWTVSDGLATLDETINATLGSYMIQTVIDLTTIGIGFDTATKNAANQFLGEYDVTIRAVAKRAIYVNDIYRTFTLFVVNSDVVTPTGYELDISIAADSAIAMTVMKNGQPVDMVAEGITGNFEFTLKGVDSNDESYDLRNITTAINGFVVFAHESNYEHGVDDPVVYDGIATFTKGGAPVTVTTRYTHESNIALDGFMAFSKSDSYDGGTGEITASIQTSFGAPGSQVFVSDASKITMRLYKQDGTINEALDEANAALVHSYVVYDENAVLRWTYDDNGNIRRRAANVYFGGPN